jgi:hypothetical protein
MRRLFRESNQSRFVPRVDLGTPEMRTLDPVHLLHPSRMLVVAGCPGKKESSGCSLWLLVDMSPRGGRSEHRGCGETWELFIPRGPVASASIVAKTTSRQCSNLKSIPSEPKRTMGKTERAAS